MSDSEIVRRLTAARQQFTGACKKTWTDHLIGDLSSDDLEERFSDERRRMLRACMDLMPRGEDDDPEFLGEPTNGSGPEIRQVTRDQLHHPWGGFSCNE